MSGTGVDPETLVLAMLNVCEQTEDDPEAREAALRSLVEEVHPEGGGEVAPSPSAKA